VKKRELISLGKILFWGTIIGAVIHYFLGFPFKPSVIIRISFLIALGFLIGKLIFNNNGIGILISLAGFYLAEIFFQLVGAHYSYIASWKILISNIYWCWFIGWAFVTDIKSETEEEKTSIFNRLLFTFSPVALKTMYEIMEQRGLFSVKELIKEALSWLLWVTEQEAQGFKVGAYNHETEEFREADVPKKPGRQPYSRN